jgi:Na+/H+ antiporter NhaC
MLIALVIITIQVAVVQGNAYWTFMSSLPMVHPITWQSHLVSIFINDTVHMGGHSSGHLVPQYSDYNFIGISSSLPICMSFNGLIATEPYNATHMPPLLCALFIR